ncbi:dihydroorotate dehydrogenase electron transfer subunit [Bacillus sp. T33-2]|uniref:dihydroorotate dehydrogenase electron transfer subunit n=1 Tax=Bacillus sp. T33-2 TaxID=2054168 RepID=UPI0035B56EB7
MKNELCSVITHNRIAASIYELILEGRISLEMHAPGQFVHLKVSNGLDPLLRRPISISSIDKEKQQFTMIYRKEGRGTTLLSEKRTGETVDVLGPLGNGFPVDEAKSGETALLIGGGIGVPPLYELARQLKANGVTVKSLLGFQTKEAVFYEEQFANLGDTYIATADGTYGTKGYVTTLLENTVAKPDILYACGPTPMLKALEAACLCDKSYFSLEQRMGCGIGACFACVCHTKEDPGGHSYKKVCSDGPVFKAGEVVI